MTIPSTTTELPAPLTADERLVTAEAMVRRNVLWSFGAGILPIPVFDLLAATAIQVKMIRELAGLYGVPFREDLTKKLLSSLLSGLAGVGGGALIAYSFAKLVPFIGSAVSIVMVPVTIGAVTHTTGKVFVMHFESGGTLLDFDARGMRAHFKAEFDNAKTTVARIFEEEQGKAPAPPVKQL